MDNFRADLTPSITWREMKCANALISQPIVRKRAHCLAKLHGGMRARYNIGFAVQLDDAPSNSMQRLRAGCIFPSYNFREDILLGTKEDYARVLPCITDSHLMDMAVELRCDAQFDGVTGRALHKDAVGGNEFVCTYFKDINFNLLSTEGQVAFRREEIDIGFSGRAREPPYTAGPLLVSRKLLFELGFDTTRRFLIIRYQYEIPNPEYGKGKMYWFIERIDNGIYSTSHDMSLYNYSSDSFDGMTKAAAWQAMKNCLQYLEMVPWVRDQFLDEALIARRRFFWHREGYERTLPTIEELKYLPSNEELNKVLGGIINND